NSQQINLTAPSITQTSGKLTATSVSLNGLKIGSSAMPVATVATNLQIPFTGTAFVSNSGPATNIQNLTGANVTIISSGNISVTGALGGVDNLTLQGAPSAANVSIDLTPANGPM